METTAGEYLIALGIRLDKQFGNKHVMFFFFRHHHGQLRRRHPQQQPEAGVRRPAGLYRARARDPAGPRYQR